MKARIGVDVGGTFTDLIFFDEETREMRVGKVPSTPSSPSEAIIEVISDVVGPDELESSAFFLHGSTVALNALIERSGAIVGLLTTLGFRDVLELRRGDRGAALDLRWEPPAPLVPRRLRHPVAERILSDGKVEIPLAEEDVLDSLRFFEEAGVESVAIAFLNAYINPAHELLAQSLLRRAGFLGDISLSHEISGEYREFERTSTTVVDAYVRPKLRRYVVDLDRELRERGFSGRSLVTTCGGGAITFDEAQARPFLTISSGPVAGAVGAANVVEDFGIAQAIAVDVGGTTCDVTLIVDGRPTMKYEGQVAGMPLQTPWVDVRSIGAGGGSLAYADGGGLLRVGPQSAGADPGPACYGRGGTAPTVTDAAAVLGMLTAGELSGGVRLDPNLARDVLVPLGARLGLDIDAVASGILRISVAMMADEIREMALEQGLDPRDSALIVFGGAGPLFGSLLARQLEIDQVVVPIHAGNFSAWGLLAQDVVQSAASTWISPLGDEAVDEATQIMARLLNHLTDRGTSRLALGTVQVREAALDLRYRGQAYALTLSVPLSSTGEVLRDATSIADEFRRLYVRTYDHDMDEGVEIVAVRASVRSILPAMGSVTYSDSAFRDSPVPNATVYSFVLGRRKSFAVVDRRALGPDRSVLGPAIIVEPTATTYVDFGFELYTHPSGAMVMFKKECDDARP